MVLLIFQNSKIYPKRNVNAGGLSVDKKSEIIWNCESEKQREVHAS